MTKAGFRSLLPLLAIALIWAAEAALVQEYTIRPRFLDNLSWHGKHLVRWLMAISCASLLLALCGKRLLVPLFALHALFSLMLLTYFDYFGFPLSEQVFLTQAGDGAEFAAYALSLVNPWFAFGLLALAVVKILLLRRAQLPAWRPWRRRLACAALAGLVLAVGASWKLVPPFDTVASWAEQTLFAEAYGYLPSWAINAWHFKDEGAILEGALKTTAPIAARRLSDAQSLPPGARNIIIIQAESLDHGIIGRTTGQGTPITPFLEELKATSLYYVVNPFRRYSTAGADFKMLTGMRVEAARIPYKIAGYPFESIRTIARKAGEKGFRSAALHGNYGYYYSRDKVFPLSGFDRVLFQQDMEKEGITPVKGYIPDQDAFDLSLKYLDGEKNLHFIITMTSHGPFDTYPDLCPLPYPYPEPRDMAERYANSINYVDYALKLYIEALPEGSLIFFYGDHAAGVQYEGCEGYFVPFYIHLKGQDLSSGMALPPETALSGEVEYAEIVRLVHDYLEREE